MADCDYEKAAELLIGKVDALREEIKRKDKALVYAIRFLDPKKCDRNFVEQALTPHP